MSKERIDILKGILLELHQGASPETVQARFEEHFTGVSAIEISLMEQELISADTGITFEDVMQLCDVHANLFKGAVQGVELPDAEHPGHPVRIFRDENLALRAALLRIRRLLERLRDSSEEDAQAIGQGLKRQMALLGQFERHYQRKEELFFPQMEKYGHTAPPKVMWGVDDQIRELFQRASQAIDKLPQASLAEVKEEFEVFATEFESMIFKEESILIMLLLEALTQDDWLQIASESDTYGYAIVMPHEKWEPERVEFDATASLEQTQGDQNTQVIDTPAGQVRISFSPKPKEEIAIDRNTPQAFGNGYLSIEEANLILNHLPMEITFVNKEDVFQYYNDSVPAEEMIFKRTPSQVGRHVELCHPPKLLPKVKQIFTALRTGKKDKFEMWFKSDSRGQFVHVTYAAVRDANGAFQGVLEYVQDIAPYRAIETDVYREIEE
ncbi:DUF438 domain-containing protein [Streptococcus ovuberis]|uniref:DUF438 domain-containing protein n=1 Tax=Streptococcus ovuberis TaxID=1936207 RepID=A0A7X6S006_9STRE|nr:DUF438 domain-containing protein [Streptococcus ovuberis]NKZ19713.1 DUF438 domain-containing protein [Streptococcus ovuberis]